MAKHTDDRSRLVAATANRLRLIQIDFADESPDVRRGYLSEAVEASLAEVLPVASVDGNALQAPGPLTHRLTAAYRSLAARETA